MKNYYSRKFLNKIGHCTTASINLQVTKENINKSHEYINGNIEIRDCYKLVTLELDFDTLKDIDNTFYKINTLKKELSKLEKYLFDNYDEFTKVIKNKKDE